jgi:hypothetical protein
MINFDDLDTPQGFYLWVMRDCDRRSHLSSEWWHKRHAALGCSPCSALCDDRFDDVHRAYCG